MYGRGSNILIVALNRTRPVKQSADFAGKLIRAYPICGAFFLVTLFRIKIALVAFVLTLGCYSLIAIDWFQGSAGSALEPTDLQALRLCLPNRQAYVFRLPCETRQNLGSSAFPGRARERETLQVALVAKC